MKMKSIIKKHKFLIFLSIFTGIIYSALTISVSLSFKRILDTVQTGIAKDILLKEAVHLIRQTETAAIPLPFMTEAIRKPSSTK